MRQIVTNIRQNADVRGLFAYTSRNNEFNHRKINETCVLDDRIGSRSWNYGSC